jgi:hypothetical protein
MRTTAAMAWVLLVAILLLGPSPWSGSLPGAEAKLSNQMKMPVTKEDIKRKAEKKQKGQPMTEDVENSLPDWEDDPVMKSKLKCNGEKLAEYRRREPIPIRPLCARRLLFLKTPIGQLTLSLSPPLPAACAVVVSELVSALKKKREQRKFKLTPDENMGALERGCFQVRRDYGLQMRNNKVTPVYSNDHSIAKTEGAWISTFLVSTCGSVVGDYDDYIIANYATTPVHELAATVCQRAPGSEDDDDDDWRDDDDDGGVPKGLGVCPVGLDMSKANTHDDGWTVEEAIRKVEEKNRKEKEMLDRQQKRAGMKKKKRKQKMDEL